MSYDVSLSASNLLTPLYSGSFWGEPADQVNTKEEEKVEGEEQKITGKSAQQQAFQLAILFFFPLGFLVQDLLWILVTHTYCISYILISLFLLFLSAKAHFQMG